MYSFCICSDVFFVAESECLSSRIANDSDSLNGLNQNFEILRLKSLKLRVNCYITVLHELS